MIKASLAIAASTIAFRSALSRVKLPEDSLLGFEDFCIKKGYKVESHWVTSKDGYILRMFRIGKENIGKNPPVLLVHGMTQTSHNYVMCRSATPPAFLLANNNYDVWLLNTRGNYYSRLHTTLSSRDAEYWDWTAHEIAIHDLPASFNYILKNTQYPKLNYIGHSQGGHTLLNCLSYLPEFNDKIQLAALLAPFGGIIDADTWRFKLILSDFYTSYLQFRGKHFISDYAHNGSLVAKLVKTFPEIGKKISKDSYDVDINKDSVDNMPYYIQKFSGGTSWNNLRYYAQLKEKKSPLPIAFDYGRADKNTQKYGQASPPRADYNNIKAKLALFYGTFDTICSPRNGETLLLNLPKDNIVYKDFKCKQDHSGFMVSNNQQHMQKVLELMNQYPISK